MNPTLLSLPALILGLCMEVSASTPERLRQLHPAQERAAELASLISEGDRTRNRAYVEENFSPRMLGLPMELHLRFLDELHDRTRGVSFDGIQESTDTSVTVRFRSHLTGEPIALLVEVEADSPHRIAGLGMRPSILPPDTTFPEHPDDEAVAAELERYLAILSDADLFSGVVLVAKDGEPIFERAYGEASKDFGVPNRVDTPFNLGSMNKMFTGVAIAQLVERGLISFQDPLSKFLPEFPDPESAEQIRIEHLLTHTSGLGNYFTREFMEASRARFRTVDEMLWLARNDSLAFQPGTRWSYSNTGMLVLGKVIEVVTGEDYFEYVRRNIFEPAGMTGAASHELDLVTPGVAVGYQKEYTDEGIRFRNNLFSHVIRGGPAGGGYATARDLLKFEQALLSYRLLGEEYTRLLITPKPEISSPRYGYGFGVDPRTGIVGHSGGFEGISSNLDMAVGTGYAIIVLSNYGGAAQPVVSRIRELVGLR